MPGTLACGSTREADARSPPIFPAHAKVRVRRASHALLRCSRCSARFIDGETGKRSDVAHHYLYNHLQNTGLEILPGTFVKRVIFE